MKLLIALFILTTFSSFAQTRLTEKEQMDVAQTEAKYIRRLFYQRGHQYVVTYVEALNLETLEKAMVNENLSEQRLTEEELFKISQCAKAVEACSLFLIDLSSEYQGGYGKNRYWLLMDPMTGAFKKISQLVYTE